MHKIKPIEDYRIITAESWIAFGLSAVIVLAYFMYGPSSRIFIG